MIRGYIRDELHLDGHVVWVPGVHDGLDHCIVVGVDDVAHKGRHIAQAQPAGCRASVFVPHQAHEQLPNCPECKRWDDRREWARVRPSFGEAIRRLLRG